MARHFDAAVGSRGQKRPADSDPEGEQPLTKKFGRLHIGNLNYFSRQLTIFKHVLIGVHHRCTGKFQWP